MKRSRILLVILSLIGLTAFGQAQTTKGIVKSVQPFNDQYTLTVNDISYVLLVDTKSTARKLFLVNRKFRDILIEKGGVYELNPKYAGKTLSLTYTVNGKGWNCIKSIEVSK